MDRMGKLLVFGVVAAGLLVGCSGEAGPSAEAAELAMERDISNQNGVPVELSDFKLDNCESEDDGYHCDVSSNLTVKMGQYSDTQPLQGRFRFAEVNGELKVFESK